MPLLQGFPLKGSESDHDVSGSADEATVEDDSSSRTAAVDETLALLAQQAQVPATTPSPPAASPGGETNAAILVDQQGGEGKDYVAADAADVDADADADAFAEAACNMEEEVASFEFAPPMTVRKFMTMQDRRVPVLIKYSGGGGFKRYFEEIAKVLKRHFPDVIIDREIVEVSSTREEEVFEIRIDGKLVCAKRRGKLGVFLHMDTFAQAIRKARQRRRPGSIVYGDQETYMNVKALTDERTADDFSLERDFKDFTAGDPPFPSSS
ncbi:unnamed protein product [Scytosiphon promiscuus]